MASSLNRATLIGHVGRDPEIKKTQNGSVIVNLSLATSEKWRDKQSGETKEATEWHRVVIFNEGLAKVIESYVKKGSKILVEGQIKTRKYKDKDGNEKYTTEITVGQFGGSLILLGESGGGKQESRSETKQSAPRQTAKQSREEIDDEIPF